MLSGHYPMVSRCEIGYGVPDTKVIWDTANQPRRSVWSSTGDIETSSEIGESECKLWWMRMTGAVLSTLNTAVQRPSRWRGLGNWVTSPRLLPQIYLPSHLLPAHHSPLTSSAPWEKGKNFMWANLIDMLIITFYRLCTCAAGFNHVDTCISIINKKIGRSAHLSH